MDPSSLPSLAPASNDREALQLALRHSHELLTLAEQSAEIGIWDRDITTNMMRGTPTFFRIMGLPHTPEPVHMDRIRAVRHPEDASRVVDGFLGTMARGIDTYESEYRIIRPTDGQVRWIFGRGRLIRDGAGKAVRYCGVDIDITERKQAEEHVRRLMQEVNHRANNLLAVVQSIVQHTVDGATDPASFAARLSQRIAGLAASNALLVSGRWQGVELDRLVRSQLSPFADLGRRVTLSGPPLRLVPAAAQAVGMALHELATNAAKHGALANATGRIAFAWNVSGPTAARRFTLDWSECDGPPVAPPSRRGFGDIVLGQMMELSLSGTARLEFAPEGVRWSFDGPADQSLDPG
jgi:PAS domain S-box-containing protein